MTIPGSPSLAQNRASRRKGLGIYSEGSLEFGTLGCVVRLDGVRYVLGSAHVMARQMLALPGSRSIRRADTLTEIATLYDASEILFQATARNQLDVALARLDAQMDDSIGDWGSPINSSTQLAQGMQAFICGAASGPSQAIITHVGYPDQVHYAGRGDAPFANLVRVAPAFAVGGDSGAAVLNDQMQVIGVHLASRDDAYSLFCPIATVKSLWPGLKIGTET